MMDRDERFVNILETNYEFKPRDLTAEDLAIIQMAHDLAN